MLRSVVCLIAFVLLTNSVFANPSIEKTELLAVVENSCKTSCLKQRAEEGYCTSYCQCIRERVSFKAKTSDVYKILSEPATNKALISQCSGFTAMQFFSSSCLKKCNGAPKCSSYCACMENKIKHKRKLSDIGDFFIHLGEKQKAATSRLRRFETSCMR